MRSRTRRRLAAVLGSLALTTADAQQDTNEAPDLDFLEYLGSWQETDEEWLAVEDWNGDAPRRERARDESRADGATDENGSDR